MKSKGDPKRKPRAALANPADPLEVGMDREALIGAKPELRQCRGSFTPRINAEGVRWVHDSGGCSAKKLNDAMAVRGDETSTMRCRKKNQRCAVASHSALALDLLREKQARGRVATTKALHKARAA